MRSILSKGLFFVVLFFGQPSNALATDWVTLQKDYSHNGVVLDQSVGAMPTLQWTNKLTGSGQRFGHPVYQDGIIYFTEGSSSTRVWLVRAVDARSGHELWRATGQNYLGSAPITVSSSALIISSQNLIALNPKTGKKLWEFVNDDNKFLFNEAIILNNSVYAIWGYHSSGSFSYLYSIDLTDGSLNWKTPADYYGYLGLSVYKDNILLASTTYYNDTIVRSFSGATGALKWEFRRGYNSVGPVVVDPNVGLGLISSVHGEVTVIDLERGVKTKDFSYYADATIPILINDRAYFFSASGAWPGGYTYLNSFNYVSGTDFRNKKIASDFKIRNVNPVYIGDRIYFPTPKGELWRMDLNGENIEKSYLVPPDYNYPIYRTLYADGLFLFLNSAFNTMYAASDSPQIIHAERTITLESPYKTDGVYNEYLGQTHSHYKPDVEGWSKLFNGDPTPAFTEQLYKDAGYDFVALTEHNVVTPDPGVEGILHIANAEEDTQGPGGNHILSLGIQTPIDESKSNQERIDQVVNQGGVAIPSHPNSKPYSWSLDSLLGASGYSGIEVSNGAMERLNFLQRYGSSFALDKLDSLLSANKRIWASASDDCQVPHF